MKYIAILFFVVFCSHVYAQQQVKSVVAPGAHTEMQIPLYKQHNVLLQKAQYTAGPYSNSSAGARTTAGTGPIFDTSLWKHRVDSTWGAGLADSLKLKVLNAWWGHFDSLYPCFMHLPAYNWDSIVNAMRTEVSGGVSKGRFAGIANHLLSLINDGHSNFADYAVNYPSSVYLGQPLFRGESGKFGACITPVYDTVALVYNVFPMHPLGLQAGDVILGYNGIPWATLVRTILQYQLPNSVYKGSTDSATWHRYIQAAGENWYLFDTINIQKCDGSIVNLPTSLMTGALYQTFCTEQMPVPGVHIPDYTEYYIWDRSVTYGVVSGTRVGYIYMYDCLDTAKLVNAVKTLVRDSLVKGLVIDIRTNFGGGFLAYWAAYEYLASGGTSWVGYGERTTPTNRMLMTNTGLTSWYDIYDTDPHYFTGKIAIICGPNAVSAGDFLPVMFKHHPRVKLFGKSTAGAFGSYEGFPVGAGFGTAMQPVNFFESATPTYYMTHTMHPVDSMMWLNKDSVCAGRDNMSYDAIRWIESDYVSVEDAPLSSSLQIFPNPAGNSVNIVISNTAASDVNIKLCNMVGSVVMDKNYHINMGHNMITLGLRTDNIPSGNYTLTISSDKGERIIKKLSIIR
ncbi:MAG: Peptidase family [Flavipsychrobacter sp.]|jgi:hypothetical protein|nr:Peptidase family [Flavipsychrobacter sp.]